MNGVFAVAAGGVVGAVARYLVYIATAHVIGYGFPYATLIVNVVGSFAMGVLVETMALLWSTSTEMRLFLTTGLLGAFTTFSTFSLDFAVLYEPRAFALCALYTIASVVLSVGALFAGLQLMRRLSPAPLWGPPADRPSRAGPAPSPPLSLRRQHRHDVAPRHAAAQTCCRWSGLRRQKVETLGRWR